MKLNVRRELLVKRKAGRNNPILRNVDFGTGHHTKLCYSWKANSSQSLDPRMKPKMAGMEEFGRQFQSRRWSLL